MRMIIGNIVLVCYVECAKLKNTVIEVKVAITKIKIYEKWLLFTQVSFYRMLE